MIKRCLHCGQQFKVIGKFREKTAKYCSRLCKAQNAKITSGSIRTCLVCKKEFYAKGNPQSSGVYCSIKCSAKSKKVGKTIECIVCKKKVYKCRVHLNNHKDNFCGMKCANKYQGRNKVSCVCRICRKNFKCSKSQIRLYCSWECRIKDKEHIMTNAIKGNLIQQNKKGLNKLELKGRQILQDLKVDFKEQVLMFNKFLVDVLVEKQKLIIQWDGVYWHTKPKRIELDKSQDSYMKKCGYKVIRVTDEDIKNNLNQVYDNLRRAIQ